MTIGFAILSYDHPQQLLRLTRLLTRMFDAAIVCNHDFGQCELDITRFPSNVRFVDPYVKMQWGHISCPLAAIRAFAELDTWARPDWFVLMSGSDYPVRAAGAILEELSNSEFDAYLTSREIREGLDGWAGRAFARYCAGRPPLGMPVYAGEFWFQAKRRAVQRLLHPSMERLIDYFRDTTIPEEAVFHTMLRNERDLLIDAGKRYTDWSAGGAHPKWLKISDVPRIIQSGAHFARKFRPNAAVLDVIGTELLGL